MTNIQVGAVHIPSGEVVVPVTVQPGWPHGDAWGIVIGHPESHDTERHRETLKRKAKSAVNDKRGKR